MGAPSDPSEQECNETMSEKTSLPLQPVKIGGAQMHFQNVQLREDVLVDEVHLEGGEILLEPPTAISAGGVRTGETRFRAVISEPNVNRLLENNIPADAPVRNLKIAFLSGKAHISGNYIKMMSLPFTVDAVPRIQNGTRVVLDFQTVSAGGMFSLPQSVVESLEKLINEKLDFDLAQSPVPVWLDTLVCEPGRLTATGRVKIVWPPSATPLAPFTARETPALAGSGAATPKITD
jgi:hypothetical protein